MPPPPVQKKDVVRSSVYNPEFLLQQARWIRDDLDQLVARDGPEALLSDDLLTLDELLRRLLASNLTVEDVRASRIHLVIDTIAGLATRWPTKLIERADELRSVWEAKYGNLKDLGILLYEPGGRLHGICRPEDLMKEKLLVKWLKTPGVKISPMLARKTGDLGFKPGEYDIFLLQDEISSALTDGIQSWWISPLFAFRDSIIDTADPAGGIVADFNGAYAILLTHDEELNSTSPEHFTYRTRSHDRGRYRLTAATRESRQPVRILRAHSLRSFWSPKAGVRYDGLHKVTGWAIRRQPKSQEVIYEVEFQRLASEVSMAQVLRRPFADEVEDYKEYKRLRQRARQRPEALTTRDSGTTSPPIVVSSNGLHRITDE